VWKLFAIEPVGAQNAYNALKAFPTRGTRSCAKSDRMLYPASYGLATLRRYAGIPIDALLIPQQPLGRL
jgi:hypothetical protein